MIGASRADDTRVRSATHRMRVLALCALGQVYAATIVVGAVSVAAACALRDLALGRGAGEARGTRAEAIAAARLAFRTFVGRPPEPVGVPVPLASVPRLRALLDDLAARLRIPAVRRLVLTPDVNAAVVGGSRQCTLALGAPLVRALPPAELHAVLAHELAHLAHGHGRLAAWTWRIRQAWARIGEASARGEAGTAPFRPFAAWYVPRLLAWSQALARAQEREADRLAAELASPRALADALTRVPLLQVRLRVEYWPSIGRRADADPRSARHAAPHRDLAAFVRIPASGPADERVLAEALAMAPGLAEAHPPLSERLAALGQAPRLPPPPPDATADADLDAALERAERLLDEAWRAASATEAGDAADEQVLDEARRRRREMAGARRRALESLARARELEPSEQWELTRSVAVADGEASARPLLESLVVSSPGHEAGRFELGRQLLAEGDHRCVQELDAVAAMNGPLAGRALELLLAHAERHGDASQAANAREGRRLHDEAEERASEERASLHVSSARYAAHGLDEESLRPIRSAAAAVPGARRALVARRILDTLPDRAAWLIGVEREPPRGLALGARSDRELAEALAHAVALDGHVTCVVASVEGRALLARIATVPGVVIWTG